ncbi:MAG: hypothetical protein ABSC42_03995 [Tepidisphaeraceae bacterium]
MNRRIEMHAVNDLIDANEQKVVGRPFQRGQIVADAEVEQGRISLGLPNPIDKVEFSGHQ